MIVKENVKEVVKQISLEDKSRIKNSTCEFVAIELLCANAGSVTIVKLGDDSNQLICEVKETGGLVSDIDSFKEEYETELKFSKKEYFENTGKTFCCEKCGSLVMEGEFTNVNGKINHIEDCGNYEEDN